METVLRNAVTLLCLAYMMNLLVMVVFRLKPHWAHWIPGFPVLYLAWLAVLCVCAVVAGVVFGVAFALVMGFRIVRCLPMLWALKTAMPPRVPSEAPAASSSGEAC